MNLKIFTAAVFVAPFSLAATALPANPSPRQPLPTNQVTFIRGRGGFNEISRGSTEWLVKPAPTLSSLSPSSTLIAQTSWKEFSSSDGKFAVAMPGTPKQEEETDEDGLTSHSFTVELENPDSAYLVTYYDVPQVAQATPEQVKELLDGTPDEFAKGGNAQLTRSQNIILDGNPGREFEFTSTEGFSGKGRVYLVEQRLFLVVAIAPQSQSIQRFLDSFRLL